MLLINALINRISKIEGWLSEKEADLLISTAIKSCIELTQPHHIVEIGSYHGKSTILLGHVAKSLFPTATIYAIDPHEGIVGAVQQDLNQLPASLHAFKQNLNNEGLTDIVKLIQEYSYKVTWDLPISMIFIDGLHDYMNVSRDFWHFAHRIQPGGYIAFHDYAHYYPGVVAFVNELLESKNYHKVHLEDSLIVLKSN